MTKGWYEAKHSVAPSNLNTTNREWHASEIDERHAELISRPGALQHLTQQRGLTYETIKRFKIGLFRPGVYMIPVYDAAGALLNVRYYQESDHSKWGIKGHSTKFLYPLLGMNGANPIWICEGEFDAMMAIQNGLHAVTTLAGAPSSPGVLAMNADVFGPHRRFVLAFDNDLPGHVAEAKIGLRTFVGRVDGRVAWPDGFDKDVSDWFVKRRRSAADLQALIVPFDTEWALDQLEDEIEFFIKDPARINTKTNSPDRDTVALLVQHAGREHVIGLLAELNGPLLSAILPSEPIGVQGTLPDAPEDAGDAWEPPAAEAKQAPAPKPPADDYFPINVVPEIGFLGKFYKWSKRMNPHTPEQYIAACAFTALSCAFKGGAYAQKQAEKLRTNLFSLLVGPSASGKSPALSHARHILKRFDPKLELPQRFSSEALVQALAEKDDPSGYFFYDEASALMDSLGKAYAVDLQTLLLSAYDGKDIRTFFKKDGAKVIEEPYICMLAGATPSIFEDKFTKKDVTSGFLPRFLVWNVPAHKRSKYEENDSDKVLEDTVLAEMQATVQGGIGPYTMQPEGKKIYLDWVNEVNETVTDDALFTIYIKMFSYAAKFAILLQANERDVRLISSANTVRAIRLCKWLAVQAAGKFNLTVLERETSRNIAKLLDLIRSNPTGLTLREIQKKTNLEIKKDIIPALEELRMRADVVQKTRKPARGPSTEVYAPAIPAM